MTLTSLCLALALTAAASVQARPDLSGTWVFDQQKTMQPGPDGKIVLAAMLGDRVVVQQSETSITLRITFQGDIVVAVYDLTGAETKNVSPGDITVISRASWKDGRLVIESTSDSLEAGKPVTVKTTRVMWIDKAGDLIVERTGSPANVVTPSRSVYVRRQLPTSNSQLPNQTSDTKLGVGSWLVVGSWRLVVDANTEAQPPTASGAQPSTTPWRERLRGSSRVTRFP